MEEATNKNEATPKRKINLRIFASFEEAAEAEALDAALKPPAEAIKETVEFILRIYGVTREQLKQRREKLHINIISPK